MSKIEGYPSLNVSGHIPSNFGDPKGAKNRTDQSDQFR